MSCKRSLWVSGSVGIVLLVIAVGCSVNMGGTPGGGRYVTITILGKSFIIRFGEAGKMDCRANQPVQQAAALRLFEDTPRETPPDGQMRLLSSDVSCARLQNVKETLQNQEQPLEGTVTIRFSMASGESADLCDSATLLSEYTINVADGVPTIADEVYELSQAALQVIMTNDVTLCIDVTTTFDVTLTLTQFTLSFGGGDDGESTGDTGTVGGQVVNAITGAVVSGATVTISGTDLIGTTDSGGSFSMADVPEGGQTIVVNAEGFVENTTAVAVLAGATTNTQIGLVPLSVAGDVVAVVLVWGETPYDLDLHMSGPDGSGGTFHAYYSNQNPVEHVFLDLDDRVSYGPETMTIREAADGNIVAGEYHVWVHNFSHTPEFDVSEARITITAGGAQLAQYDVGDASESSAEDIWHVVNLTVSEDGAVTGTTLVQSFLEGDQYTMP